MPQRYTDNDTVSVRLLPTDPPPIAESGPLVELRTRRQRWGRLEEVKLWKSLRSRARRHDVAMVIEYEPSDMGPRDVVVSAMTSDGLGLRWRPAPVDVEPDGEGHILEVRSDRPIGQRLLTQLGVGRVHEALRLALGTPAAATVLGERWGAVVAPKPGRRGRPDLFYAQVALEYVEALRHEPTRPVQWILERARERGEDVTADEVKARLRRARKERGLLTESPRGRPGGELTDKAKELLRAVGLLEEGDGD